MEDSQWSRASGCPTHYFSLVVVRHPTTKKYLAVKETRGRGVWLPGGFVENGDNHHKTALKETLEEAGLDVELLGVLAIQSSIGKRGGRQRVIYYAEPKSPAQQPKSVPDEESEGAFWVTLDELEALSNVPPPKGLRGDELLVWARYLEKGGPIYPLGLLQMSENGFPHFPSEEEKTRLKAN